ncbi:Hypothetical protein GLP15_2606 [Giardia lamblia P15]|uniref:Uncharacterized protein n=1 Tax=Giardia intestinalis (strain P15) TaxID=658858 RepID=E1F8T7_GIAIA|nr:Hypothetical protein GLP15_2606 [Giardia lamblia P15]
MIISEESSPRIAVQGADRVYSPKLRVLGSKEAVAQLDGALLAPKAHSLLHDPPHQPLGATLANPPPLKPNKLSTAPMVTETEPTRLDSKNLHTQSNLTTCMLQLLRDGSGSPDNHGLRYMFCQGSEPNLHVTNNEILIPDALPSCISPSMLSLGIAAGLSLPLPADKDGPPTSSSSIHHCQPQPQNISSTNLYFQLPGSHTLTLFHDMSNITSKSNDLLYSTGKQAAANHCSPFATFTDTMHNKNQASLIPQTSQIADEQSLRDQNVFNATIAPLPPIASSNSFPCILSPSNTSLPEYSERFATGSIGSAAGIKKWNTDDELTFFRLILCYNGTKYTKFAKNFPNKPIKSLNNKWQIEKKRAQKNMYLDWKTVIVSMLCRYLHLLEQSRGKNILKIRNALTTALSSIDTAAFCSFDKSNHAQYSRILFKSICEMLGDEQLKFLDIDLTASSA